MGVKIARNTNDYTLTVTNGAQVEDIYIGKIAVVGYVSNNFIYIYYEGNLYISGLYSIFTDGSGNPLGNSVQTVEAAIAALLYLPSSGSGGVCCPLNPTPSAATSIHVPSTDFDGKKVYLFSASSTVKVVLPDPSTVTVGGVLRLSMQGGAILDVVPFNTETLDGQAVNISGVWTIPQPNYSVAAGEYFPAQQFALYTDGTDWFSALNF